MAADAPLLEIHFRAIAEELGGARGQLREQLAEWGTEGTVADDIVLAVGEACQNIICHGYCEDPDGVIELRAFRRDQEVEVWLRDFAAEADPKCLDGGRDLDDVRPGGLGTHFIRELMDVAEFVDPPEGRGNLLHMIKRL